MQPPSISPGSRARFAGVAAALVVAGCGDDQRLTVAHLDGASIAAGEHTVESVVHAEAADQIRVAVSLDADDVGPCAALDLTFCARDVGKKLRVRPTVKPDDEGHYPAPCSEAGYVPNSIHGYFSATCGTFGSWELSSAEAQVDADGDDIHVVLQGSLDPAPSTVGRFDVDVDVVSAPDGGS